MIDVFDLRIFSIFQTIHPLIVILNLSIQNQQKEIKRNERKDY